MEKREGKKCEEGKLSHTLRWAYAVSKLKLEWLHQGGEALMLERMSQTCAKEEIPDYLLKPFFADIIARFAFYRFVFTSSPTLSWVWFGFVVLSVMMTYFYANFFWKSKTLLVRFLILLSLYYLRTQRHVWICLKIHFFVSNRDSTRMVQTTEKVEKNVYW